jgi:predicted NUDIX family NTP pyrophosphohydrolase
VVGASRDVQSPSRQAIIGVMAARSAGIALFRRGQGGLEFLLVHPGGPFWAKKDDGAWSIPKGEYAEGEDPLRVALRELEEETGLHVNGEPIPLRPVRQRAGKEVVAWGLEGDFDPAELRSNTFHLEWPPRSGKMAEFPEVDRATWVTLADARIKLNPAQLPLLEELAEKLG